MTQIDQNSPNDSIPLLPFYVYVLMHPETKDVFYVGKGKGVRMQQHSREVRQKISIGQDLSTTKQKKIKEIIEYSGELLELVVARFETEDEAFAVEATLIKWMYGFDSLTNEVHGRGSEYIREINNYNQSEFLDIPASVRSNDGSYRDSHIAALQAAGAYNVFYEIRRELLARGFDVRDFDAKEDRPFHPGESNGRLALLVRIKNLDFIISLSKSCSPSLFIANTLWSRRPDSVIQLNSIYEQLGEDFFTGPPKNIKYQGQGRYRVFSVKPRFERNNLESLYQLMGDIRDRC